MIHNIKDKLEAKIKVKRRPFTQEAIARQLNISQAYLSRILTGKRNCPKRIERRLHKIVDKLG